MDTFKVKENRLWSVLKYVETVILQINQATTFLRPDCFNTGRFEKWDSFDIPLTIVIFNAQFFFFLSVKNKTCLMQICRCPVLLLFEVVAFSEAAPKLSDQSVYDATLEDGLHARSVHEVDHA